MIISLLLCANLTIPIPQNKPVEKWYPVDDVRITCYCCACNDGSGHESSSGKYLEYGDCACNWLPIGTKVSIEGEIFTVVDTCGMNNTIDIFVDTDYCNCNLLECKKVMVKE